jgi:hypothetical protein
LNGLVKKLIAEREFIGSEWIQFLSVNSIRYYIRSSNNFRVYSHKKNEEIPVFLLFNHLKMNDYYHYSKIFLLHGQLCNVSGKKN